jgi:hypothetical protein
MGSVNHLASAFMALWGLLAVRLWAP